MQSMIWYFQVWQVFCQFNNQTFYRPSKSFPQKRFNEQIPPIEPMTLSNAQEIAMNHGR
jgi:hypothetical protein